MSDRDATDHAWMQRALALARQAEAAGEVPVGAVVVAAGQLIGEGWNRPIAARDPTAHAEIVALRQAAAHQDNYRLPGATLYVTLEPCMMCLGAMVHARIERLVFAARDPKSGVAGGAADLADATWFNHRFEITAGVCAEEAAELLRAFFRARRGADEDNGQSGAVSR
jgi:tRNA(adenine34) deaminase